jgi:tetratricopeptide (TPR) repeat protein
LNEEALSVGREIGSRTRQAYVLHSLGTLEADQADASTARKRFEEALALREELGEKVPAAETRMAIAQLSVEAGKAADAEAPIRRAIEVFKAEKVFRLEALAMAHLAELYVDLGRLPEAESTVAAMKALAEKDTNVEDRASFSHAEARVLAAKGRVADAVRLLRSSIGELRKKKSVRDELENRLLLGQIETRSGDAAGSRRLDEVRKDAERQGLVALARRAAAARKT